MLVNIIYKLENKKGQGKDKNKGQGQKYYVILYVRMYSSVKGQEPWQEVWRITALLCKSLYL